MRLILNILILFVGFEVGVGCCGCCCCGCNMPTSTSMTSMNMTMCMGCDCCCDCCGCDWAARKKRDPLLKITKDINNKETNSDCDCENCDCKQCDLKINTIEKLLTANDEILTTSKPKQLIDKTVITKPKFEKFTTRANRHIQ